MDQNEVRLKHLLSAYRDACVPAEPGANFMPELWRKIEAKQRTSFMFQRISRWMMTTAAVVTMAMAFVTMVIPRSGSAFNVGTYVEILANLQPGTQEFVEPMRLEINGEQMVNQDEL